MHTLSMLNTLQCMRCVHTCIIFILYVGPGIGSPEERTVEYLETVAIQTARSVHQTHSHAIAQNRVELSSALYSPGISTSLMRVVVGEMGTANSHYYFTPLAVNHHTRLYFAEALWKSAKGTVMCFQ